MCLIKKYSSIRSVSDRCACMCVCMHTCHDILFFDWWEAVAVESYIGVVVISPDFSWVLLHTISEPCTANLAGTGEDRFADVEHKKKEKLEGDRCKVTCHFR